MEEWIAEDTITPQEEVLAKFLPTWERQFEIKRSGEEYSYWLDFAFPSSMLAIEIDGHPINLQREAYLSKLGWKIIHLQNEHFATRKKTKETLEHLSTLITNAEKKIIAPDYPCIYTAGPMESEPGGLSPWRKKFLQDFDIAFKESVGKIRIKSFIEDIGFIHPEEAAPVKHDTTNSREIVDLNYKAFMERCNLLVAYLKKPSQYGTITEMFWAKEKGIPIILAVHEDLIADIWLDADSEYPYSKKGVGDGVYGESTFCSDGKNHSEYWYVEEYLNCSPTQIDSSQNFVPLIRKILEKQI